MNNIVSVYQAIFNRIDTILDNEGLPVFKNRAVWNDNVNRILAGKSKSYWMPSVWVEMQLGKEINLGGKLNGYDITFIFHIVHMELDALDGTYDQNFNIFTYRDLIHKKFLSYTPVQCGAMRYAGEQQNYNHNNYYEYIIKYQSHYIDQTADPLLTGEQIEYTGSTYSGGFFFTQSVAYWNS